MKGAGIIFTNGNHVLCGWNRKAKFLSGIGGSILENEFLLETAVRETLEELFEIIPSFWLIQRCIEQLGIPKYHLVDDIYVGFIYNFNDLRRLLNFLESQQIKSMLYNCFPRNVFELITFRIQINSEITNLGFVPIQKDLGIDPLFVQDLNKLA